VTAGSDRRLGACDRCLARPWLLARLAGHLDVVRGRIGPALELSDEDLIEAVAGGKRTSVLRELARFDPDAARRSAQDAELELICRCEVAYPARLAALPRPPAVLHVAGGLDRFLRFVAEPPPVAIVGARRTSDYGLEVASSLGRGLGAAGVAVVSGMALGIDSVAHSGALAAGGATLAVLPAGAERAYPRSKHRLWRQIQASGAIVAELPPGTAVRRWMFPARNRIIAALAAMTVVVEASERSGALTTASFARELGRSVGGVPGRVSSRLASGPNALIASGAVLVDGVQAVLDEVFGFGARRAPALSDRPELSPAALALLDAIGDGADTPAALSQAGFALEQALATLATLELAGYVRREVGGRFTPVA
jgi:DNA processing protein